MLEWWDWSIALSIVFGVLNVFQFVQHLLEKKAWSSRVAHLEAIKDCLRIQLMRCNEAIELGEVIKTDSSKDFVRQIGYSLIQSERHIDAILRTLGHPGTSTPSQPRTNPQTSTADPSPWPSSPE
jgi:hypothetical protein